ncbi:MAG: cell surface protein SprA [Ignavibacteriaceae bacterium]|nr:cell surface protein SprA [Ignavibacteriaceae bacterium]
MGFLIKQRFIKLVRESICVTILYVAISFAVINFGFSSPYISQVNKLVWVDACFNLLDNNYLRHVDETINQTKLASSAPLKDLQIPLSIPPDSGSNKNSQNNININAGLSNSVQSDTGEIHNIKNINPTGLIDSLRLIKGDSSKSITRRDSGIVKKDSLFGKKNILKKDSLFAKKDTIKKDWRALDSTARIKYFKYRRYDSPVVQYKRQRESSFFLRPSDNARQRTVKIDSTGKFVEFREKYGGEETKILLRLPIDEYLDLMINTKRRESWEDLAYSYQLNDTKRGLGELIKDFTDFEIPLPSVGVLTIFGAPKISLKIGGAVDIHGAWRNTTTEGVTASNLGNSTNEPDFKQEVQINVNGTIGDKLNITADWNTERTFEYENQLKIKYTGYEDEIIQSIEGGNVSLETSPLVGGSEALFGVKAQLKLGPLNLTALASQKKGEIKEVAVSGGSTSQTFQLRAYDYSTNHYFLQADYADTSSNLNLFNKYFGNAVPIIRPEYRVVDIQVWKSVQTIVGNRSRERYANAFINLNPRVATAPPYADSMYAEINPVQGQSATGRFVLLTNGDDYILHPETGFISFKTQVNDNDIIAVAFRQEQGPGPADDFFYGDFITANDTSVIQKIVLKMIKPANLQPQFTDAWKLQLKNIYPVGGRNVKQEGFDFEIKRETVGQEPSTNLNSIRFLTAFGLDLYDASLTNPNPDNVFDWRPNLTILPATGEIIFPTLQPFGRNLPAGLTSDFSFDEVYDTSQTFARQVPVKDKWLLTGKYSGDVSSVYQLGFNIVENSVKVLLNGRQLSAGTDYIVDYNIGQLTIRNDAALVPGADLKISYEQNDLFQLASKTLLGLRGLFDFSKKTKLGFSILNLNQQTLSQKVRIGEEPLNNTIYGVDFTTGADLPFITKGLDKIISTKEMSSFSVTGEYAYIKPDPNTIKSTIPSDQGKSIAYIDDFESAKKIIPVGVSYTAWKDLSPPTQLPQFSSLWNADNYEDSIMAFKGKTFWYSITPSPVTVPDLWGTRKVVAKADQQVSTLDYVYIPDTPGTYAGYGKTVKPTDYSNPKKSWGGIMKLLSSSANNLVDENMEYIEFWANPSLCPAGSKIYIDLGRISEDVIPNKVLDTEDKPPYNDLIDPGEDNGLDGLTDAEEQVLYHSTKSDPAGDDFSFQNSTNVNRPPSDFFNINGTEGNAVLTDIGRIPDTEDLNRNGNLDLVNSYFRYEVPLDTLASSNKYIKGGGYGHGWFLYQIPLKDFVDQIGNPSLTSIETIRLFTTNISQPMHLQLAEFNLVGNQWQQVETDSVLTISVKSIEDDPDYYSPPGVTQQRDLSNPNEVVLQNEQALDLVVKNMPAGQSREIVKYISSLTPLDVFDYSEMKLFVHGDLNPAIGNLSDTSSGSLAQVYFRFGGDSLNYYEYRQPVKPDWNEIDINFSDLTALKQKLDSAHTIVQQSVPGKPGHLYEVRGSPTLTSVKFLLFGVVNIDNPNRPKLRRGLTGDVWVNELRVIGANQTPGWAYNIGTQLKLADLLTLNFTMSETNPFFHRISDRFGSRMESKNWGISADMDLIKLLPFNLPESSVRVNYSHTESISAPLYLPGTDILISSAAYQDRYRTPEQVITESQTVNVSDSYSASNIKIKIPTNFWLIRDTFNNLSFGFNYNTAFSRSPTVLYDKSWQWNASANYGLTISPDYSIAPGNLPVFSTLFAFIPDYSKYRIFFLPQNISAQVSLRRMRTTNVTRVLDYQIGTLPQETVSRDFTAQRGFNLTWKMTEGGLLNITTNYNVNITSTLAYLETDMDDQQRSESQVWRDIFRGALFGRDNNYQQTVDIRTNPVLPSILDIGKYFKITAGYSAGYQWMYNIAQGKAGRSAGNSGKVNMGLNLSWKSLTQGLFTDVPESNDRRLQGQGQITVSHRGRERNLEEEFKNYDNNFQNKNSNLDNSVITQLNDSLKTKLVVVDSTNIKDTTKLAVQKKSPVKIALLFTKTLIRIIFFDYESFAFNFTNENTNSKSGLYGSGTGFYNFWGFNQNVNNGPSRLFMLGLSSDVGRRADSVNVSDNFSQRNSLDFKTSRPLWEGAKIDVTWQVAWSINKSTSLLTDANGIPTVSGSPSVSGTLSRSFLSFPPVFFLSAFNSGIKRVAAKYNPESTDPDALSNAFVQGFESLPIFSRIGFLKDIANYIPRPNWRINWDGLEKYFPFKSIAKKVSLDHAYVSNYTEGWSITPDGIQQKQSQQIDYGFAPLVGLNITFADLWGGNIISNIKYSTKTNYDLGITTKSIIETFSSEIGITAGFSKSGFELPLFGLFLKNDIEFSLSYTKSDNTSVNYDMSNFVAGGAPQDGTTRISMEPRIKYTLSSKVTLSIFYTRTSVQPDGPSRITPSTTNEAGLDVHISIQ